MKTITVIGVLFVLCTIGATSCSHKEYDTKIVNNDTTTQITPVGTPSFERDIFPIFKTNCASSGCHNAASRSDGYEYTDYQTTMAKGIKAGRAEDSKVYEVITTKDVMLLMPPGAPLLQKQQDMIRDWIDAGAPNN